MGWGLGREDFGDERDGGGEEVFAAGGGGGMWGRIVAPVCAGVGDGVGWVREEGSFGLLHAGNGGGWSAIVMERMRGRDARCVPASFVWACSFWIRR